jgi:hypothetical protein
MNNNMGAPKRTVASLIVSIGLPLGVVFMAILSFIMVPGAILPADPSGRLAPITFGTAFLLEIGMLAVLLLANRKLRENETRSSPPPAGSVPT